MNKHLFFPTLFITSLLLGTGGTLFYNHFQNPPAFLNPQSIFSSAEISMSGKLTTDYLQPITKSNYQVIGFLPYWLLNQSGYLQYDSLTQIAYFGIEFDKNGELKTREPDGSLELGLHRLRTSNTLNQILNQNQNPHLQNTLVIKILNNEGIEAAINPVNRNRVISQILQLTTQYPFANLNIDFEYIRTPPLRVKTQFTEFIKILNQKLKTKNSQLSIDIYADAALKQPDRLWQLADLVPYVDYFIVMGYDFHRPSSPQAGPIAPIRGSPDLWEDDLVTSLRAITQLVPPQKIILGLPFYGYEWDTYTNQPKSVTIKGTGRLATYSRVQDLLVKCHGKHISFNLNCILGFDPEALSPFIIYQNNDHSHQIWYEDSNSLKYKLQLIKEAGLAGLAIWALGYESPYPDLWQIISQELSSTSPN